MANYKPKKPNKPMTTGRLFRNVFLIALPICLVVFTIGAFGVYKFLDSKPASKSGIVAAQTTDENLDVLIPAEGIFKTELADNKRVNILLYGDTDEHLADTIMLCSFDPDTKEVDVISVPRDTYYEREKFNYGAYRKINSSATEGPLELCKAVHEVLLGIPINYYAKIGYDGIKNVVDSIGGVKVNVPMDMKYTSKKQNLYIDIDKGEQVLDGDHAVQFLRFRKGYVEGDMGRVKAQQQFVKNAAKQALSSNIPKVVNTLVENVDSTISPGAVLYLANEAKGMKMDAVQAFTLPGDSSYFDKLWFYLRADNDKIETMLKQAYGKVDVKGGFTLAVRVSTDSTGSTDSEDSE